jgi:hypothetical protein
MLVLFAGGFFRFYGLRVGFPFEYHVDEWFIVNRALDMYRAGSWKPPAFDYPSLIFYYLLANAHLLSLWREPTLYDMYVLGRAASAFFGTGTIVLVYLTGKRAYGARVGLLAAAFFAFTVTALREAHFYTTDSLNAFFITLAVYFIIKTGLGDERRNYIYAGIAIGLAAGSKYNGAFLVVPLVFAHLARESRHIIWTNNIAADFKTLAANLKTLVAGLFSVWLVAAGAVSLLVFLLTTPYAVLAHQEFLKDLAKMGTALSVKVVEGNHHYLFTTPYWYYIENLLFWAMNPLLEAACLLGFFYALARRRTPDIIMALWLIVYFAIVGGWLNKAVRYTLPMLPFLTLCGAAMFVETHERLRERGQRRAAIVVVALASVVLSSAFLYSLAFMNVYREPHTGIQATEWAFANVPAGSTILLEGPTPHERPQVDGQQMIYRDGTFDFDAHHYRFKYLDVPKFTTQQTDEQTLRAELDATLEGVEYIIMSTRWQEGLIASPEASPVIKNYYRSLLDGSSHFELLREITLYPALFGLRLDDDASELNFRIFDHPKVWIFRRKKEGASVLNEGAADSRRSGTSSSSVQRQ